MSAPAKLRFRHFAVPGLFFWLLAMLCRFVFSLGGLPSMNEALAVAG